MISLSVKCAKCNEKLDLSRKVSETVYHCPACGLEEVTTDVPNLTQKYVGAIVCELCNRIAPVDVKEFEIFNCQTCGESVAKRKRAGDPFIPKVIRNSVKISGEPVKLSNGAVCVPDGNSMRIIGEGEVSWEPGTINMCSGYSVLVLDERITSVGKGFLKFSKDLEIVYAPGVKNIEASAFRDCYSLRRIVAPNLKYIGREAFSGCTELYRIEAVQLESIAAGAFDKCYALEHVTGITCDEVNSKHFKDCAHIGMSKSGCIPKLNNNIIAEASFEVLGIECVIRLDDRFNLLQRNHIGDSVINVYNDFESFLNNQSVADFGSGFEELLISLASTHTGEKVQKINLNTPISEVLSAIYGNYQKIRTL